MEQHLFPSFFRTDLSSRRSLAFPLRRISPPPRPLHYGFRSRSATPRAPARPPCWGRPHATPEGPQKSWTRSIPRVDSPPAQGPGTIRSNTWPSHGLRFSRRCLSDGGRKPESPRACKSKASTWTLSLEKPRDDDCLGDTRLRAGPRAGGFGRVGIGAVRQLGGERAWGLGGLCHPSPFVPQKGTSGPAEKGSKLAVGSKGHRDFFLGC